MGISSVIIASGFSKRMGKDKLKMKLLEKSIFEYIVDLVYSCDLDELIIVTNDEEISEYSKNRGFNVIENNRASLGKSESIKVAIKHVKNNNSMMFFVADQPLISKKTVSLLIEKSKHYKDKIIYPMYGETRGSPIIFPPSFKRKLNGLSGDQGGVILIDETNSVSVQVGTTYENMDIDTELDYERLLKYAEKNHNS